MRIRGFLLAFTLLALPAMLAGCSPAKRHYNKAEEMLEKFQNGDRDPNLLKQAQAELRESVKADPNFTDAHKSLANVDEVLGDADDADKEYQTASMLDPSDQKLLAKARYYRYLKQVAQQAGKAVDAVKAGDNEQGMTDLETALKDTKTKGSRDQVIGDLKQALPIIVAQGDKLVAEKKYIDGVKVYEQAIRGYRMMAIATNSPTLDPGANDVIHKANEAAKNGGAPDMTFKLLNDVLAADPDNKTANIELAQVYLRRSPPDYSTAADLMERAGAPDAEVNKLRKKAKHH